MSDTDVIGGITVHNPHRWLEEETDPAVQAWQAERDEQCVKALATSVHAEQVRSALERTFEDLFTYAAPQRFGSTWFHQVQLPNYAVQVLAVGSTAGACTRVLVDPHDSGPDATIAVWTPSPDGDRVVVGTGVGAALAVQVLDVETGEVLLDLGVRVGVFFFAWAPDGSGFWHQSIGMTTPPDGSPVPQTEIWWQPLEGTAERQDLELDHPIAWPVISSDGRWTAVFADQTHPRPRWVRRANSDWRRFLPHATAMYKGSFVGDEFWAITDDTSGWCRLVAIPVDSADNASTWRELMPAEPGTKLAAVTPCGSRVALAVIRDGAMRLLSLDTSGEMLGEVPMPSDGAFGKSGIGHIMSILGDVVVPDGDGDGCVFVHSALDRSPGVYRADLLSLQLEELIPPAHVLRRDVEVRIASGPQGPVRYRLLRKSDTPLDGSAPTIVTGYGGFNIPWLPCYSAMAAAWTELGGVWVHAHLRGGGEEDAEFWHAGRMHRKQGTFDDAIAVLEDLYASGLARADRTGVWGSSNGGLLIGALVTQRPNLLRAAVSQVPLLDMLQSRKDPGTLGAIMADYGNPDDPADAPVLHAYSPYHRIRPGTAYPAVLLDAGTDDTTSPPWHCRKTAAALSEATTSGRRVLLRVRDGVGHNSMTRDKSVERDVEELIFFADELKLGR